MVWFERFVVLCPVSRDTETDGHATLMMGHQADPGALLEISYFTDGFAIRKILQHYFGSVEANE
jgi:hypothetical protein